MVDVAVNISFPEILLQAKHFLIIVRKVIYYLVDSDEQLLILTIRPWVGGACGTSKACNATRTTPSC